MDKSMTIQQAEAARRILERGIRKDIEAYEQVTGLIVESVDIEHVERIGVGTELAGVIATVRLGR